MDCRAGIWVKVRKRLGNGELGWRQKAVCMWGQVYVRMDDVSTWSGNVFIVYTGRRGQL
jgi:hypothetical protein